MMINKKLVREAGTSIRYVRRNVFCQWVVLLANIVVITLVSWVLSQLLLDREITKTAILLMGCTVVVILIIRYWFASLSARYSERSSHSIKQQLRSKLYRKLLMMGGSYHEQVSTSEIVQVSVEGVDQLETYFSSYLPQLFYSILAPLTLFVFLLFFNWKGAIILFLFVPLIPISIAAVQTFAKKLLAKYWGQYTTMGDHFLENLQGLTTLKIYQADERQQQIMREEAEKFRRITMRVLTMQLNSITIMDLVAFGGAALGTVIAILEYRQQAISLQAALMTILLAAEFFIPMRLLGSFFHIAMNGMAASDKIFRLLELPLSKQGMQSLSLNPFPIRFEGVSFAYDDQDVVMNLNVRLKKGSFTAIIGESGCGKSTTAALLMGEHHRCRGNIYFGNQDAREVKESDRLRWITRITHQAYLFSGTVRENLCLAKPDAQDKELWEVLRRVQLASFLEKGEGLDTVLMEQGSNLSGGQRQRLALARALLHDSEVYIFDEATSNIDVESETLIMEQIELLAKTKTVLLITHRLANIRHVDYIYVMDQGRIVEEGTFQALLKSGEVFHKLWDAQQALEQYGREGK